MLDFERFAISLDLEIASQSSSDELLLSALSEKRLTEHLVTVAQSLSAEYSESGSSDEFLAWLNLLCEIANTIGSSQN